MHDARICRGSCRACPLQSPRPITLNAAFSPPGREFAAKAADYLFTTFTEIDKGREHIDDMKTRAAATGREVGVMWVKGSGSDLATMGRGDFTPLRLDTSGTGGKGPRWRKGKRVMRGFRLRHPEGL